MNNKITANDRNVKDVLGNKFYIDSFQREYRWAQKHLAALIDDLARHFLKSYEPGHEREEGEQYRNYYLGPVVFHQQKDGSYSIVDGQQRITSLTLLLIYLKHKQEEIQGDTVNIDNLICSEKYGKKTFNMHDADRKSCMQALFDRGKYDVQDNDNETVKNIVERYNDIDSEFPAEDLLGEALPYFIEWLLDKVVLVEIITASDEDAYLVFETMNDRGLNLTLTEMLKGYVLSQITVAKEKTEINNLWKKNVQRLHTIDKDADKSFFQSWFRGKYATTIRPSAKGSTDQDFELIGAQFHTWFKNNHEDKFGLKNSGQFYQFFKDQFNFFVEWYCQLHAVQENDKIPHLYYINNWGIAPSLQDSLLLSVINYKDSPDLIYKKLSSVARLIETFAVRRAINHKRFGGSGLRYTFFNHITAVRNKGSVEEIEKTLKTIDPISAITWDGVLGFKSNAQNKTKKFVRHLLSRISSYIDQLNGGSMSYSQFFDAQDTKSRKPFEIEHILHNNFGAHTEEYEDKDDFELHRNKIGALVLLPKGTNQSYGGKRYEDKLEHYLKENTYVKTLNKRFYENNPNFVNSPEIKSLGFKSHEAFKKADIDERTQVVKRICEQIWG